MTIKDRFRRWREVCEDRLVPMAQRQLDDGPFQASIDAVDVGSLAFTRFELSNVKATTSSRTIRHSNNKTDHLFLSSVMRGTVRSIQNDRSAVDAAGDLSLRDPSVPWTLEHKGHTDVLALQVPRHQLEAVLGPARHFAGLTMDGRQPLTKLTRSFLSDVLRLGHQLSGPASERLTSIAIDLIAASVAERMAKDTPKSLRDTVSVQQAKAFIQSSLGDPDLDPPKVAAAVGISARHLHSLFAAHGHSVATWIWQRRLEKAARHLADPGNLHMQLGLIAFGCGFSSQAHFSRRFRDRYGISPRDYREQALTAR